LIDRKQSKQFRHEPRVDAHIPPFSRRAHHGGVRRDACKLERATISARTGPGTSVIIGISEPSPRAMRTGLAGRKAKSMRSTPLAPVARPGATGARSDRRYRRSARRPFCQGLACGLSRWKGEWALAWSGDVRGRAGNIDHRLRRSAARRGPNLDSADGERRAMAASSPDGCKPADALVAARGAYDAEGPNRRDQLHLRAGLCCR
jgi:hypothetical protein